MTEGVRGPRGEITDTDRQHADWIRDHPDEVDRNQDARDKRNRPGTSRPVGEWS